VNRIKNHVSIILKTISLIAGVLLFLFIFRDLDINSTYKLISHIGYLFVIVLSLYFIGSIADALAWKSLLESSTQSISFIRILLIHIAGESFYRFLPAGVVVGESVKVFLIRKHSTFLYPAIVSSLMMRKLLMGISQAFYIGTAVFFGVILSTAGQAHSLIKIGTIISIALLVLFISIGYLLYKKNFAASVYNFLMTIPIASFQKKIALRQKDFISTDLVIQKALLTNRKKSGIAFSLFLFGWFTELAETYMILIALNTSISFADALMFEPIVSFLRSVVFFIPGGLGIMDFGYSASIQSISAHTAGTVAAAFIITKRAKELFWIIIGVSLTVILGKNGSGKILRHVRPDILPNLS